MAKKSFPKTGSTVMLNHIIRYLVNKYYMDNFNSIAIVRPTIKFANLINRFDKNIIDGFINLVGKVTVIISKGVHIFDRVLLMVLLTGLQTKLITAARD